MRKEYDEGFAKEMEELYKDCEGLIDTTFKATNASFMDMMNGLDEETGAIIGGSMKIYRKSKDLSIRMVKQQDEMYSMIKELKLSNLELQVQNEHLRDAMFEMNKTLTDLGNKIVIVEKKNN